MSLSSTEKTKIAELKSLGLVVPNENVKNPGIAGALNILPGFGNFYLAIGTNESEQWLVGFLNLLFWPISVVWGIPEGAIDASTINKRESVYYYTYGPGVKEVQRRSQEAAAGSSPPAAAPPNPPPVH